MSARVFSSGDRSGQNPPWYWCKGLHDAHILRTEFIQLSYNYTQKKPRRTCLKIYLDASQAMFDTTVASISLYNYKLLVDESDKGGYGDGLNGCYWMQDSLSFENGKYILQITALGEEDFRYCVRFEDAEIQRIV